MVSDMRALVGNTPLYELKKIAPRENVKIYAKLEFLNLGGSIKDRLGFHIIEQALASGKLQRGGTVIEPTAGNTAIGLALAGIYFGVNVMVVVPDGFSVEKQLTAAALGAEIVLTPKAQGMKGAIAKAQALHLQLEGSYFPNQFANEWNPATYYHTLGPEISNELDALDYFVAGAGTAGTFMGTSRYLKEQFVNIKTAIVEPEGSIINGGLAGPHRTEGIGMELFPPFFTTDLFDEVYTISDDAAFLRVKQLASQEGLLVGSSSGAALDACLQIAEQTTGPLTIVTIFPDSSDRYLTKNIFGGQSNA